MALVLALTLAAAPASAKTLRGAPASSLSVAAVAKGSKAQLIGEFGGKAGRARNGVELAVERFRNSRWRAVTNGATRRAGTTRTFKVVVPYASTSCVRLRVTVRLRAKIADRFSFRLCDVLRPTAPSTPQNEQVPPPATSTPAPTAGAATTPTPAPTATATHTPTVTPSPTASPTPTATASPSPTSAPSPSPSPTATPSPSTGPGVRTLAAGWQQSCALEDGTAWCWGDQAVGDPYYDIPTKRLTPEAWINGVRSLSTWGAVTCAVLTDGRVNCRRHYSASEVSGEVLPGVTDVAAVAIGGNQVCFVRNAGTVGCFSGAYVSSDDRPDPDVIPVSDAPGIDDASAVAVGHDHYCVLRSTGAVQCFGDNDSGQLGIGTFTPPATPEAVHDLADVADISADGDQTCALRTDGTVWCWGKVWKGATAPSQESQATPAQVYDLGAAKAISVHADFSCLVRVNGSVACWGAGAKGQLGDGESTTSAYPVTVSGGLTNATAVSAGENHACATTSNGDWWCWGDNEAGQLGTGFAPEGAWTISPPIPGISGAVRIDSEFNHSCVVQSGGTLTCWGANNHGQLGRGTVTDGEIPAAVDGLSEVTDVAVGSYHTCALRTAGDVLCWGRNLDGQLGDGTTDDALEPTAVEGLDDATAIAAGTNFTCALREGGTVVCWGSNEQQQLGTFDGDASDTPVAVDGVTDAIALDAGTDHACVIRADHNVVCWGANDLWQAGDPDFDDPTTTPRRVPGITTAVTISVGANACAGFSNGEVDCWGQIQDPARDSGRGSRGVAPIAGMGSQTRLAVGRSAICGVNMWGQGQCFGWPVYVGENDWDPVPDYVIGLHDAFDVGAGQWTTCFVINDGTVRCRGWNNQLANGIPQGSPIASLVVRP
ncbi:MAG: hypothetical protein J7513_11930 [Solirubrobacteraceae bacterium]|nr:hypothetical protein [Solirubrobacteraceae bacterium]